MRRPTNRRTIGVIAALALATVAGVAFKEKVIPPTPLILTPAGANPQAGPADHFIGAVTIDTAFKSNGGSAIAGARVTFQAGARSNWHSHPKGQVLVVTQGRGWVQDEGGAKRELKAGDTVWTAPDVKHWHGATPYGSFTLVAIAAPGLRGTDVDWGEPVSDAQYRAAVGQASDASVEPGGGVSNHASTGPFSLIVSGRPRRSIFLPSATRTQPSDIEYSSTSRRSTPLKRIPMPRSSAAWS